MTRKIKIRKAFSQKAIAARVARLGRRIRKDAGEREIFLLAILKGSSCFLADLLRAIPGNVRYGFIDVVRDQLDTEVASALEIDFLDYTDISGRNVYLLKDVVSTGVVDNYLLTHLRQKKPSSLKLVALLDHTDLRSVDIKPDYRVFEVGSGDFVGYGLEREGRHGNLPYIGRV